ncbi:MAG TPA: acyl-CoA dehydrogenase family protein [Burkholderiales bacterium]|nr:acyl-CoA dehydrogenase family protein [Burkholderiales bacterium]
MAGGVAADRVAWAFASGYQAALRALFPAVPDDRICALCVTEAEGNSPRAIKSSLRREGYGWVLNGAKRWTTLGPDGALFFVAARDEAASADRPAIKVAKVFSGCEGLHVQAMPQTRFVPEVPHAQLQFENLKVAETEILPGDGYAAYVKPFRTVEDIYVNAAILAYLVREARRLGWPDGWVERCCSLLLLLEKLAGENPNSPETHLALAGALAISAGLMGETEDFWKAAAPDPAGERWQRDRELLKVAGGLRAQRTARAWENLRRPGPAG